MAPAGIGAWGQRLCGLGVPSCAPHAVNLDCDVASSYTSVTEQHSLLNDPSKIQGGLVYTYRGRV